MKKQRCDWVNSDNKLYVEYHDTQWGVPVFDDRLLFEMLILEGAQAGLSWITILKKRENYRQAFDHFDVLEKKRHEFCRLHNYLCVYAGGRHGKRPPDRLFFS